MTVTNGKTKKSQTKKVKTYLYKVKGIALSNNRYRWGINIFEKYRRHYVFSDSQLYTLGLLYDHLVIFNKKMEKNRARKYLKKAESIYQSTLKREPKSLFALYGLGRVSSVRGDYKKALFYQKKAYRLMQKRPRRGRGALAVGALYENSGNYKKAELSKIDNTYVWCLTLLLRPVKI